MDPNQKKPIVRIVEAARGFAAFHVLLFHIDDIFDIAAKFPLWAPLINLLCGYGHQAVIFFFLLSGFSISYSQYGKDLSSRRSIRMYAYQRFRRIYPTLVITLLLGASLIWAGNAFVGEYAKYLERMDVVQTISSLLFLGDIWKGAWFPTFPTIPSLWSLSYEIVYYLAFPFLWRAVQRFGWERVLGASILFSLLAAAPAFLGGIHSFPGNVASLYWPWVAGAYIGYLKASGKKWIPISPSQYLMTMSWLITAIFYVNRAIPLVLVELPFLSDWLFGAAFGVTMYFFMFPDAQFSGWQDRAKTIAGIFIGWVLFVICAKMTLDNGVLSVIARSSLAAAFFSFFSLINAPRGPVDAIRVFLRPFGKIGGISYALYLVHFPILLFFFYCGGAQKIAWGISLALACPLIFLVAWFFEKPFQKRASALLDSWIKPHI
jgi:peptidoglycan/LPS O-acetylase OafA/YrhL